MFLSGRRSSRLSSGSQGSNSILLIKQMLLFGRILDIGAALIAIEGLRKGSLIPDNPRTILWSRVAVLLLVGFFPSGIFYSFGSLYRDPLIYGFHFLTVALLLHVVTERRLEAKLAFLALSIPSAYALFEFRQYAAYSVVLAVALWCIAQGVKRFVGAMTSNPHLRRKIVWYSMTIFIFASGCALWYTRPVQQLFAFRDSYFSMQGSNLRISFTGKNPIQAFPLYLYSFFSNAIGPLVWQVRTASNLLNFLLEVPLLSYVTYGIWRRRTILTPACTFLIAQAIVWFSLISFSNDNLGTASRLRVLGWQCLFVVAAYLIPRMKVSSLFSIRPTVKRTGVVRPVLARFRGTTWLRSSPCLGLNPNETSHTNNAKEDGPGACLALERLSTSPEGSRFVARRTAPGIPAQCASPPCLQDLPDPSDLEVRALPFR